MSYYSRAAPNLTVKVARALNVNAEIVRSEMYGLLERNKVGRGVHYPGLPRRSSAPYDPPARQYGRLQESIAVVKRATPNDLTADTGPRTQSFPDAYYAAFLEYGTRRMMPRPFVRPTASIATQLFRNSGIKVV